MLVALLALLAVQPLVGHYPLARLYYTTLWSVALIATIFAISEVRWQRYVGLSFGLPIIAGLWGRHLLPMSSGETIELPTFALAALFFAAVAVMVMRHLVTHEVTADNVAGAVCAYLFLGLGLGAVYTIIEALHANSFHASGGLAADLADPGRRAAALTYFSFATLTTTGYGDMAPATALTRILAVLEAVLGHSRVWLTIMP